MWLESSKLSPIGFYLHRVCQRTPPSITNCRVAWKEEASQCGAHTLVAPHNKTYYEEEKHMAKIITITGAVGGTGKTTLAANLAAVLAELEPQRVLCLDLGSNAGLSVWFNVATPVTAADFSVAARRQSRSVPRPSFSTRGVVALNAQMQSVTERLAVISYERAKPVLTLENLATMQADYDYVVIDATHVYDETVACAYAEADLVLISGGLSLHEPRHLPALIARIKQAAAGKERQLRSVLHTRVERDLPDDPLPTTEETARRQAYYPQAYTQPGLPPLCQTSIRADEAYEEALVECRPLVSFRPDSKTVQDYQALATELREILPAE
jgi:cellulose biosynthesis protein BcsQ